MKLHTLGILCCLIFGIVDRGEAQSLSTILKQESPDALAKSALEKGNAVRGAILFPQQKLTCTHCHAPGGQDLLGPDLTRLDKQVTDIALVESLLNPSKILRQGFETVTILTVDGKTVTGRILHKQPQQITLRDTSPQRKKITISTAQIEELVINKTSAMPEKLMDQLENRQQFLDLVRYLMTLRDTASQQVPLPEKRIVGGKKLSEDLQGLLLLDSHHCTTCHQNDLNPSSIPAKQAPDLTWSAGRIDPAHIGKFLASPHETKPGTAMPDVMNHLSGNARKQAVQELTHYLVSLSEVQFERQTLDQKSAEHGGELFHSVGCVACHSPRDSDGNELLTRESVPLGTVEEKYNLIGLTSFLENPHQARPSGRMPNMKLTHWEAVDIASYLLERNAGQSEAKPFKLDTALAIAGKKRFAELGCMKCHEQKKSQASQTALPLSQLKSDQGCLSTRTGRWPKYHFIESDRTALQSILKRPVKKLTDRETISLALTTFNCVRCHQREELGGITPDRDSFFQTANPNLGPQGRIPPTLTGIGAKLKPKWLRQVLVSGRTIRPYMKTRMPQCGTENIAFLVDLFQKVDQEPEINFIRVPDQKAAKLTGHQLVGMSGLNCVACHTFQQKPAATMPAVDLTEMAERLEKSWFYRYMKNPQQLSRGTVMPSFWPGGRAIRQDILAGNPDQQLEALWQYLQDGRQARVPQGLIRKPIELLATNEAVMLRRSYPGIGKRGIGVGYPRQVNLAFDAEQIRLAMIWKGKFADPSGVWRSQGHGRVRPLGTDQISFPTSPELQVAMPDRKTDSGRPPDYQFKGYELDELRRPKFFYRFRDIDVSDYPVDMQEQQTGKAYLLRTVTLTSKKAQEDLTFRVAAGEKIVQESPGIFRVDEKLRIQINFPMPAKLIDTPEKTQLLLPLKIGEGTTTLTLKYLW